MRDSDRWGLHTCTVVLSGRGCCDAEIPLWSNAEGSWAVVVLVTVVIKVVVVVVRVVVITIVLVLAVVVVTLDLRAWLCLAIQKTSLGLH